MTLELDWFSVAPTVSGGWPAAMLEEGCEVPEALRRCEDFGDSSILESLLLVACVGDRVDLSKLLAVSRVTCNN